MTDPYEEAKNSPYERDSCLLIGFYSVFALVRYMRYSSPEHLSEDHNIVWNENHNGIVWNVEDNI